MSLLGDYISRKVFILGGLSLTLVGRLLVSIAQGIWMGGAGMMCSVFGLKIVNYVCFTFTAEIVSEEYRQNCIIILETMVGLGAISNVLWFYLFENYLPVLILMEGIPCVFALILFAIIARDTPINMIRKLPPS